MSVSGVGEETHFPELDRDYGFMIASHGLRTAFAELTADLFGTNDNRPKTNTDWGTGTVSLGFLNEQRQMTIVEKLENQGTDQSYRSIIEHVLRRHTLIYEWQKLNEGISDRAHPVVVTIDKNGEQRFFRLTYSLI